MSIAVTNDRVDLATAVALQPTSELAGRAQSCIERAEKCLSTSLKDATRKEMHGHLDEAYRIFHSVFTRTGNITPEFKAILPRLFYLQGRLLYDADKTKSSYAFRLSLVISLLDRDPTFLPPSFFSFLQNADTLDNLEKVLMSNPNTFALFDEMLLKMDSDVFVKTSMSGGPQPAFQIGCTLRFLGHCYQNIDTLKTATPDNIARFDKVYGLCGQVLDAAYAEAPVEAPAQSDNPNEEPPLTFREKIYAEHGDLEYNTCSFMHKLRHPGDIEGAIATYARVEPYLKVGGSRGQNRQAQIFNMRAILLRDLIIANGENDQRRLKECYELTSRAIATSEAIPERLRDTARYIMFINNLVALGNRCHEARSKDAKLADEVGLPNVSLREMLGWQRNVVVRYMATDTHGYNPIYYCNAAETAMSCGELPFAEECLQKAQAACNRSSDSTADMRSKIEVLQQKLAKLRETHN